MSAASCEPTVGIVVNPLAGTDIRRLVAAAAPTTDMAKVGVIRRAVIGAAEGGARRLVLTDDRRRLAERALDRIERDLDPDLARMLDVELLEGPPHDVRDNTVRAAAALRERGAGAVVVLGGDGTHRDFVLGWRDAPIVAVSTGTNNVFPSLVEATLAGHAAGCVAAHRVPLAIAARRSKVIDVGVERADGENETDLALVDVALVDAAFTGTRAVWHGDVLRSVFATIAEPASVGLASIAAACMPCDRSEPFAVHVTLDPRSAPTVRAPVAPGRYADLAVTGACRVELDRTITMHGPGALTFDGERHVVLGPGDEARLRASADGPHVIDIAATLTAAAARRRSPTAPTAPDSEED